MDQKIKVNIAGQEHTLKADTPQQEEIIRKAAVYVNNVTGRFQGNYPNKEMSEILSFTALHIAINFLLMQRTVENAEKERRDLESELQNYLANIDK